MEVDSPILAALTRIYSPCDCSVTSALAGGGLIEWMPMLRCASAQELFYEWIGSLSNWPPLTGSGYADQALPPLTRSYNADTGVLSYTSPDVNWDVTESGAGAETFYGIVCYDEITGLLLFSCPLQASYSMPDGETTLTASLAINFAPPAQPWGGVRNSGLAGIVATISTSDSSGDRSRGKRPATG